MISSFRKKQTVRRYSGGHYDDNGEWQKGSYEELSIMASVQPLNQNEQQLPEGSTVFNAVKIYSDTPLRTDKQALKNGQLSKEGDVLVWRGRLWKIVQCADWQSDVINHFKMIAWEIEPEPDELADF